MLNEEYVEMSARLRILEKRLLDSASVNRMIDIPSAQETLRQIAQNSGYDFPAQNGSNGYEVVLREDLAKAYRQVREFLPNQAVADIPAAKYEFHNIKAVLKAWYAQMDAATLFSDIPALKASDIVAYLENGDNPKAPLPDYAKAAIDEAKEAHEKDADPQDIDITVDSHMFARMLALCAEIESEFITGYVRETVDFHNIKTLLRVKAMQRGHGFLVRALVPGGVTDTGYFLRFYDKSAESIAQAFYYRYFGDFVGKGMESFSRTETLAGLERMFDNRLMELLRGVKLVAYGPEVPFAYLLSKENEVRQIRILMACKQNGIHGEALRERLRDNYA